MLRPKCLVLVLFYWSFCASAASDYPFNWTTKTDRDGKPAGYYSTTPFPLTETWTSYTNATDEGATIYNLGTLYFVDGAKADDTGDGTSLATAKKTIAAGITAAGSGNKTVLVRGAHDAFDGVYSITTTLLPRSGAGNTTRWMLCGYAQERPTIKNATLTDTTDLISILSGTNWTTLQRLKVADTTGNGLRLDGCTNVNLIDLWVTNCIGTTNGAAYGDGLVYLVGASNTYISHVTAEHTFGHAFKMSDSSNVTNEWSIAREWGYWDGITTEATGLAIGWRHPAGFDFRNTVVADNLVLRYSLCYSGLAQCVQFDLNGGTNAVAHHNEVYSSAPPSTEISWNTNIVARLLFITEAKQVIVRDNIIRDLLDPEQFIVQVNDAGDPTVTFWNNLLRGSSKGFLNSSAGEVLMLNNTLLNTNASTAAIVDYSGAALHLTNNIVVQGGAANALNVGTATHGYNRYWVVGGGSVGVTLAATESSGDPSFSGYQLSSASPCIGTGVSQSLFTTDILGTVRGTAWDIGAYEYVPPTVTIGNLNIGTLTILVP